MILRALFFTISMGAWVRSKSAILDLEGNSPASGSDSLTSRIVGAEALGKMHSRMFFAAF